MIFRLSQKLNTKIKVGTLKAKPLDANPYADWSCHLFTADRTQYILLSNTPSLYSVVMYGRGITDDSIFVDRALSAIREFMEYDGQTFVYQKFIAPASGTVTFAKALNRSATGSLNELTKFAKLWLTPGDISPFDVGFRLNDLLMSAVAPSKKEGYGKPNEAFRAMLGSQPVTKRDEE